MNEPLIDDRMRLDYARDRLLLQLCYTLRYQQFDCSPTGANMLRKDLEVSENLFKSRLDEHYPDPQELK